MYLSEFLCASFDQCNIPGLRTRKKSPIDKLNLQTLAIFAAKCGKFFNFFCENIRQNLAKFGISNVNFPRCQFCVVVVFWGSRSFCVVVVLGGSGF